jgi:hypothetical protein
MDDYKVIVLFASVVIMFVTSEVCKLIAVLRTGADKKDQN